MAPAARCRSRLFCARITMFRPFDFMRSAMLLCRALIRTGANHWLSTLRMACVALPQGRKIFAQIPKLPENPLFKELSMLVRSEPSQRSASCLVRCGNRNVLAKREKPVRRSSLFDLRGCRDEHVGLACIMGLLSHWRHMRAFAP